MLDFDLDAAVVNDVVVGLVEIESDHVMDLVLLYNNPRTWQNQLNIFVYLFMY